MNIYHAFIKVIETGNFTKAEELGYTQSAISQMVNSLEKELSTLILRSRTGITLTPDGEEFCRILEISAIHIKNCKKSKRDERITKWAYSDWNIF